MASCALFLNTKGERVTALNAQAATGGGALVALELGYTQALHSGESDEEIDARFDPAFEAHRAWRESWNEAMDAVQNDDLSAASLMVTEEHFLALFLLAVDRVLRNP